MAPDKTRILLVEDNPGDALLIEEIVSDVSEQGWELEWVDRISTAAEKLEEEEFDIILLDLFLPDSKGVGTFRKVSDLAPDIPIILLSGLDDQKVALETVQEGAQDYLVKGRVDDQLLLRSIRYAIERRKIGDQLAEYASELERKNTQIQAELDLAGQLQKALLPKEHPSPGEGGSGTEKGLRVCHRYIPTTTLAGDFYHILPVSKTQTGIFICDVMGHGMRAALVSAVLRGLVEHHSSTAADPGTLLTNLNLAMIDIWERTRSPIFASAFYAVIDAEMRRMEFANAGHPTPYLIHAQTREIESLLPEGRTREPALGLLTTFDYRTCSVSLAHGDSIVLYTDGVFEVDDVEGHQFGEEGLMESLRKRVGQSNDELLEGVLEDVRKFAKEEEFADDVCLVGIEVNGEQAAVSG